MGVESRQTLQIFSEERLPFVNFLLDTNIIIDFLRDKPGSLDLFDELLNRGRLAASLISYGELEYGARLSKDYKYQRDRIEKFIEDVKVEILPLTRVTMEIYAKIRRLLEIKGRRLDDFDLLIGATAVENDLTLVTDNIKHFGRFPDIKLYLPS